MSQEDQTIHQYQLRTGEEANLLLAYFNSVDQYQILLNEDLKIVSFNNCAHVFTTKYLGLGLQKGKPILDNISPSFRTDFISLASQAFEGETVTYEHFIYHKEKTHWFDFTITSLYDDCGDVIGVMIVGKSIDEIKSKDRIIKNQNESLSIIAQLQSHQVRQPVSSILGLLNLIKEDNMQFNHDYLLALEGATKQLDTVIKVIVSQSRKDS